MAICYIIVYMECIHVCMCVRTSSNMASMSSVMCYETMVIWCHFLCHSYWKSNNTHSHDWSLFFRMCMRFSFVVCMYWICSFEVCCLRCLFEGAKWVSIHKWLIELKFRIPFEYSFELLYGIAFGAISVVMKFFLPFGRTSFFGVHTYVWIQAL